MNCLLEYNDHEYEDIEDDVEHDTCDKEPTGFKLSHLILDPWSEDQQRVSSDQDCQLIDQFLSVPRLRQVRLIPTDVTNHINGGQYLGPNLCQSVSRIDCEDKNQTVASKEEDDLVAQWPRLGFKFFKDIVPLARFGLFCRFAMF